MKLQGQLQWKDVLNAQLLISRPTGVIKILLYGALFIIGGGFFIAIYLLFFGNRETAGDILVFIPLLVGLFLVYRYVILPSQSQITYVQQKGLSLPFECEFTDSGMFMANQLGNNTIYWKAFTKWKEDKNLLLLFYTNKAFCIIPKRIFTDTQQIEFVKSHLQEDIVPDKRFHLQRSCIVYIIAAIGVIVLTWIHLSHLNP